VADAHQHFVSCIRWAPAPAKEPVLANGESKINGTPSKEAPKDKIRCVIATGSVDAAVRVFAS